MKQFQVAAPTRVDLAGGTLDLWPLYTLFPKSRTINAAINLNAYVNVEWDPKAAFSFSLHAQTGEALHGLEEGQAPLSLKFPLFLVNRYVEQNGQWQGSLRLSMKTEAPLRSGLGGSSTLCIALLKALETVYQKSEEPGWRFRLLNWAKDLEAGFLRTPTGTQDYLAALFGSLRSYNYSTGSLSEETYAKESLDGFKERLLVVFSGEMHHSGLSNWEIYKQAIEGNATMLGGLNEIRVIADNVHAALKTAAPSWSEIGKLLNAEWDTRRNVFKVQTPRLDEIITFLRSQTILGAKVCGAASGGSLLVLVDPAKKAEVVAACQSKNIQVLSTTLQTQGVEARAC